MNNFTKTFLLLVVALFINGCTVDFTAFDSTSKTERAFDNQVVNPSALYNNWSNYNGNFTLVNNSGETIVVSTDKNFKDDFGVDFYKFSATSFQIDMRDYGGSDDLVWFYAITLTDLEYAHTHGYFKEGSVKQSIAFIPTYGGTWSPFNSSYSEQYNDTGVLVISNHSNQILKIVIKDIFNQPEGQVNRGETNVRLQVPADGLYPVYILNAETLELIEEHEIGISKNATEFIEVGEKQTIDSGAEIKIVNNTELHFNAYNRFTRSPMANENCNGCSTIIKGESGLFTVNSGVDIQIQLESTSGNQFLQTDLLNLAQGQTSQWVIQRNADGNLELKALVENNATANFSFTTSNSYLGKSYNFVANEPYASGYFWSFGDGYYSYSANPSHVYNQAGTYKVDLITSSYSGATQTSSLNVLVK